MGDDRLARDAKTFAAFAQSPPQLDVLPRGEALVEVVGEESVPLEDRGHDPGPVLAPTGVVVVDERLPPIAGTGFAVQAGLEGGVAAPCELREEVRECPVREDDVDVDQRHGRRARGADADDARRRDTLPSVREDRDGVASRDLERPIGRIAVDDDDLPWLRAGDRRQTVVDESLGVAYRYDNSKV
jgi:hypothetical protein